MFLKNKGKNQSERGAALAIAIIIVAVLSVIALTALAFSSTEARIAKNTDVLCERGGDGENDERFQQSFPPQNDSDFD
jgi:flagellar basal body-associated protein FliL